MSRVLLISPLRNEPGASFINNSLIESGHDVSQATYIMESSQARRFWFERCPNPDIIALSVPETSSYFCASLCLPELKKIYENIPVIVGGSHFAHEYPSGKDRLMSVTEIALRQGFDAVNIGGSESFIKAVNDGVSFLGPLDVNKYPGIYQRFDGEISGKSESDHLSPNKIPLLTDYNLIKRRESAIIISNNSCKNGCGYCRSPKSLSVPKKAYENFDFSSVNGISVADNNPFAPYNIDGTEELLRILPRTIPKTFFLDPSLLVDSKIYKRIVDYVREFQISNFFVGRDTPSATIAEKMGRRLDGRIRTQDILDAELEGLKKFCGDVGVSLHLSYIITPWDDESTLETIRKEVDGLQMSASNPYLIEFQLNKLTPFPGTRIRSMYTGLIREECLYNFGLYSCQKNLWIDSVPGYEILNRDFENQK